MTNPVPSTPSRKSSLLPLIIGGCAVLALCGVLATAAGAGYWFISTRTASQPTQPTVEYVLDASPRMALESEGSTRLAVAQGVLAEIVRPAEPTVTAGLRVFGSGALPTACKDTDLVVPLAPRNQGTISDRALGVAAGGGADAAMAEALVAAIRDLASTAGPHTLVVVTGGTDSCNPEAGKLIAQEAQDAGIKLELFVVGYQVPEADSEALKDIVAETTGATYLNALTPEDLRVILLSIQSRVDKPATVSLAQVFVTQAAADITPVAGGPPNATNTPVGAATAAGQSTAVSPGATATPGDGGAVDAGGYRSQTACDNPWLPLRAGAVWNYTGTYGDYVWTVTDVSGDLTAASATMTFTSEGSSISYHWQCTSEGLVSYDLGSISGLGGDSGAEFKVVDSSGTWLPPASQLNGPKSWSNNYTIQYSFTGEGQSMEFTSVVSQQSSTDGVRSSVAVGAGTFDALRIDQSSTTTVSGLGSNNTSSGSTTYWLGYGVGIIKSESTFSNSSSSTTLASYSVP